MARLGFYDSQLVPQAWFSQYVAVEGWAGSQYLGAAYSITDLADSVTISDDLGKSIGLSISDSIILSDSLSKGIGILRQDSVSLSDGVSRSFGINLHDSVSVSDNITLPDIPINWTLSLFDSVLLSDYVINDGPGLVHVYRANVVNGIITKESINDIDGVYSQLSSSNDVVKIRASNNIVTETTVKTESNNPDVETTKNTPNELKIYKG